MPPPDEDTAVPEPGGPATAASAGYPPPPLAWPVAQHGWVELPAGAPVPPQPPRRRRSPRALLAATVLAMIGALALGSLAARRLDESRGPAAVVAAYFGALSTGDAPAALALAATPPASSFLTSTVLREQLRVATLSDVVVGPTTRTDGKATVDVSYRLGFAGGATVVHDHADLVGRGSLWRLAQVASPVTVVANPGGAERLLFAGRPLPRGPVVLFPGAVPLSVDSAAVEVGGKAAVSLDRSDAFPSATVTVSAAARQRIIAAVDAALAGCLAARLPDPLCPAPAVARPVPASLHGSQPKRLAASTTKIYLDSAGRGVIDLDARASAVGTWRVWNFTNQVVAQHGLTSVLVKARVSVDRLGTVYWTPSS